MNTTTSAHKNTSDKDFGSEKDLEFDFSLCHSNCCLYSC